jgi:hypothetical protein
MPAESTVRAWALDDVQGFSAHYSRAREIGYLSMADEMVEIADDTAGDTIKDNDGNDRADHEWISRSRLRVDTRKWLLSKALPKVYGDKIETTTKLVDENDAPMDALAVAQRLAFLLNRGVQALDGDSAKPAPATST